MWNSARALGLWLSTTFRAAPLLVSVRLVFVVLDAASAPAQVLGLAWLVDGVTGEQPDGIVRGAALLVATFVIMLVSYTIADIMDATVHDRVHARLHADLLTLTTSIPGIAHHERPDVADRLNRLREDTTTMGYGAGQALMAVATVVNTVAVLGLLLSVHPLLLVLPILALGRVWAVAVSARLLEDSRTVTAPHVWLVHQLMEICGSPKHGMEIRVFGLPRVLLDRVARLRQFVSTTQSRASWRGAWLEVAVRMLFGFAYGTAIIFVIWRARAGLATAGDVTLVVLLAPRVDQAAAGVAQNVRAMVETSQIFGRYLWLRDYARAEAWASATAEPPSRLRDGISFRGVSFTYPGAGVPALTDIDLRLPAGATVALVGENGAGKTTLVKLLARFYDPTAGRILVDGDDLRLIDPRRWRDRISAGFQDFCTYELRARDAVGFGDLARIDDDVAIATALERGDAGTIVERLPNGLATQLGTRFSGGVELSGGQWQRIALARALMRDEPLLLLLDEPTAALDPEAEHALFERFAAASKATAGRTGGITVLVSHRFSTVRMADLVAVVDGGRLVELGSHAELMARPGGRYAELFELQARQYR